MREFFLFPAIVIILWMFWIFLFKRNFSLSYALKDGFKSKEVIQQVNSLFLKNYESKVLIVPTEKLRNSNWKDKDRFCRTSARKNGKRQIEFLNHIYYLVTIKRNCFKTCELSDSKKLKYYFSLMWLNATRGTTAQQASSGGQNSDEGMQADSSDINNQMMGDDSGAQSLDGQNPGIQTNTKANSPGPQARSDSADSQPQGSSASQISGQTSLARSEDSGKDQSPSARSAPSAQTVASPKKSDDGFETMLDELKTSFNQKQGKNGDENLPWVDKLKEDLTTRFSSYSGEWEVTQKNWNNCQFQEKLKGNNNGLINCGAAKIKKGSEEGTIRVGYTWHGNSNNYTWELKVSGGKGGFKEYKEMVNLSKK